MVGLHRGKGGKRGWGGGWVPGEGVLAEPQVPGVPGVSEPKSGKPKRADETETRA